MRDKKINMPTQKDVELYNEFWKTLDNYVLQEKSLDILFHEHFIENKRIEDILIKASALNDFYSTNIFSIYAVANHILEANIDGYLVRGEPEVVAKIAHVTIDGKEKNFYSFASKYCSHHNDKDFPIYDFYVEKMLLQYKNECGFGTYKKEDLRDYGTFKEIMENLIKECNLSCGLKELDRFLWISGKITYPKKNSKNDFKEKFETFCKKNEYI